MREEIELLVPTLFGLEGLCAQELRRLELPWVAAENGRVRCGARLEDIPRVELSLRTGERVLVVVGRYEAKSFDQLFEGAKALPWEDYIPREGAFPVKGYSLNSQLHAVPAIQGVLKKALAARLGARYGMEHLPENGALYQVQFSLMADQVTLMLDTTGPGLHKRGYRAVGVAAPLRETLAAALVLLSRYRGKGPFCDPFCGSGTIPIEAALIAKNRAPGLNRSFSAQRWKWLDSGAWLRAAQEAMDKEYQGSYDIWGGDIDPRAVELARANAEKADVEELVRFEQADARQFRRLEAEGRLVTNPPYGERILEKREAELLYRAFGQAAGRLPEGWQIGVLSSHTEFERAFGRPAEKKRKLYNGMLKCDLFQYGIKRMRAEK